MQWHLTDKTLTFVYYIERLSSSHNLHLIPMQLLDFLSKNTFKYKFDSHVMSQKTYWHVEGTKLLTLEKNDLFIETS